MEKQPNSTAPAERSATPSESRSLSSSSRSSRGSSAFHGSMTVVALGGMAVIAYLCMGLLEHKAKTGDAWPFYVVVGGFVFVIVAAVAPAQVTDRLLSIVNRIIPWGKGKTDQ